MSLKLRYMMPFDIRAVAAIDALCFQPAWSRDSYAFEINQSRISHMAVLERQRQAMPAPVVEGDGWLTRLGGRLRGESPAVNGRGAVLGYGGLWKIDDEAHISTIATHPESRGRGYGEVLLAGMFGKALELRAEYIVLEVRVSNIVAQRLYDKYGFRKYRRIRNYYRKDHEDAYDMRVTLDRSMRLRYERLYEELKQRCGFRDEYSRARRPRRYWDGR